ncbi:MAG: rRNA maturation RNase YbeY [Alphaproteobacteria bacterium]
MSAVAVLIHDRRFAKYKALARKVMKAGVTSEKLGDVSLTVVLTNDAEIRPLNHDFRGRDKATNVLSFPDGEGEHLGDIVLAYETIRAEAKAQGKRFEHHLAHLLLHGLLHLNGHDHEKPAEAKRMEKARDIASSGDGYCEPLPQRLK